MGKLTELKTTSDIVKDVLENIPETRNSDDRLYQFVCALINVDALKKPFVEVMANRKELGLPAFETVRRTRQKIQELHPELAGCDKVEGYRKLNEEAFKEYAKEMK